MKFRTRLAEIGTPPESDTKKPDPRVPKAVDAKIAAFKKFKREFELRSKGAVFGEGLAESSSRVAAHLDSVKDHEKGIEFARIIGDDKAERGHQKAAEAHQRAADAFKYRDKDAEKLSDQATGWSRAAGSVNLLLKRAQKHVDANDEYKARQDNRTYGESITEGANFVTLIYPGNLSQSQVQQKFRMAQEDDRYENGNSYSGGIGMAGGLTFAGKTFPTDQEAEAFVSNSAKKWEHAVAVRIEKDYKGNPGWFIGAWCSS